MTFTGKRIHVSFVEVAGSTDNARCVVQLYAGLVERRFCRKGGEAILKRATGCSIVRDGQRHIDFLVGFLGTLQHFRAERRDRRFNAFSFNRKRYCLLIGVVAFDGKFT